MTRGRVRVEHGRKRVRAYLGGELAADTSARCWCGRCRTTPPTTSRPATSGPTWCRPATPTTRRAAATPRSTTAHAGRHRTVSGAPLRQLADRGAAPGGAPGLGRHGRVAGGGRARLHPSPRPLHQGRHPGQLPARPGRGRRRDRRRLQPAPDPVRDRPSAAVLPPAHRRPAGPAPALGHPVALPLQGHGQLLVAGHRARQSTQDFVWIYRSPLPESQKIAGLACFYNEKVDIYLDGVLQQRPQTKFS